VRPLNVAVPNARNSPPDSLRLSLSTSIVQRDCRRIFLQQLLLLTVFKQPADLASLPQVLWRYLSFNNIQYTQFIFNCMPRPLFMICTKSIGIFVSPLQTDNSATNDRQAYRESSETNGHCYHHYNKQTVSSLWVHYSFAKLPTKNFYK
jgi:hypothetical protein